MMEESVGEVFRAMAVVLAVGVVLEEVVDVWMVVLPGRGVLDYGEERVEGLWMARGGDVFFARWAWSNGGLLCYQSERSERLQTHVRKAVRRADQTLRPAAGQQIPCGGDKQGANVEPFESLLAC